MPIYSFIILWNELFFEGSLVVISRKPDLVDVHYKDYLLQVAIDSENKYGYRMYKGGKYLLTQGGVCSQDIIDTLHDITGNVYLTDYATC